MLPALTELPWCAPERALASFPESSWLLLLNSGGDPVQDRARWSYLCPRADETLILSGGRLRRNGQDVSGTADMHLRDMCPPPCPALAVPFPGGLAGIASYEAGMRLEGLSSRHQAEEPEIVAASFTDVLAFDRLEKRLWWISGSGREAPDLKVPEIVPSVSQRLDFIPEMDRETWCAAVRDVIRLIGEGDLFQANITQRWRASLPQDFREDALYLALSRTSPAPFGTLFRSPEFSLLSASVERFLSMTPEGLIETRPIKGTAMKGKDEAETALRAAALAADPKECAENLMITDLMRNDIGRVCLPGSVRVPQLCAVEPFAHLLHLVSVVQGQLRPGRDRFDLLRATLPPGSVTGAPKYRAMEVIDTHEVSARGAYCGTLFRLGRDGGFDSSVIIRSLTRTPERLCIGAGGGITWPSDPEREYEEACLKAAPLLGLTG
ncbi:anthranilate synthase component I family protein [Acetobacter sp. AN02]|uniref:anthranilate synthase component I family protein n=1 Tax=Acetobacter sp. AN02 TaxID=2894186 RepID=UPI0024343D61|nr:anthranilate synthase component I family protein [Acetobacter sp. AN02]MDG6095450.1 anthranilate synthase component I family protein [Acetobacter sp. AN02]